MNALTREYALCDGKVLKNKSNGITSYPQLNKNSTNFANWSGIYNAMANSMIDGSSSILRTPPLFEMNQFSPRYLRCLNWLRGTGATDEENTPLDTFKPYDTDAILSNNGKLKSEDILVFANNNKKYIKITDNDNDIGNIIKDIHEVGVHLSTNDAKLRANRNHIHLEFVSDNELPTSDDTLSNCKSAFMGGTSNWFPGTNQTQKENWLDYIKLTSNKFNGTSILRTVDRNSVSSLVVDDNILTKIKNAPIAFKGGSISFMTSVHCGQKFGFRQAITLGLICTRHKNPNTVIKVRAGAYKLACPPGDANHKWRFISSLQQRNRYGKPNNLGITYSFATFKTIENNTHKNINISIDDSLPIPPSINLIPLIKI